MTLTSKPIAQISQGSTKNTCVHPLPSLVQDLRMWRGLGTVSDLRLSMWQDRVRGRYLGTLQNNKEGRSQAVSGAESCGEGRGQGQPHRGVT